MKQYFLSIRVFCLTAALLAVPLLIGGCGGSDSSQARAEITVETGSMSKVEFVKRADAICKKSKAQALREFSTFPSAGVQSAGAAATSAEIVHTIIVPIYGKLIDQFTSLGAPKGDEQDVAGFLNTLQQNLDLVEEEPTKALNGLSSPFKPAAAKALRYGLTTCASTLG